MQDNYIAQLPHYDDSEVCAEGYTIYYSNQKVIENLARQNPQQALEFYLAISRYNFYGEEYTGSDYIVAALFATQKPLIEKQREKYAKAVHGGQKNASIDLAAIVSAIKTGQYKSMSKVGEHFGVTGQAIGQRLKRAGLDFKTLLSEAENNALSNFGPEPKKSKDAAQVDASSLGSVAQKSKDAASIESNFSKVERIETFVERNPNNNNNNNYNITTKQKIEREEPGLSTLLSGESKKVEGFQRISSLIDGD